MKEKKIAIIGLGYVGLPLAVEFSKKYLTIGFDINSSRVKEINEGHDRTLEIDEHDLTKALKGSGTKAGLSCTDDVEDLREANIFIITVPTPINKNYRPDLNPLINASRTVGNVLKKGDLVIYESTVYPGATEEECVPVLENTSGLRFNQEFYCGYSPERINPGDKKHTLTTILKVTSGSTSEVAIKVDDLYRSIITAGTHLAPSIKVAEAAKVIENSQRDINIAFVNELAKIFNLLDINTQDVLEAAGTKWNFLPFKPGLVGGHCIGVDPFYLAQKAQEVGYNPEIILAGRRLNDGMGAHVAHTLIKELIKGGHKIKGSTVLVLGITFKENCPDIRNTRVIDIINELKEYGVKVDVYDPWADYCEVEGEFNISLLDSLVGRKYDGIVLGVSHREFLELDIESLKNQNSSIVYDVKSFLPKNSVSICL